MRRGCLNFLFRLGTSVVSAALIAVGSLLLIIGLLSSSPLSGARTVFTIIAALVAAYLFIRVGREIWRDLRTPSSPEEPEGSNHTPNDDK